MEEYAYFKGDIPTLGRFTICFRMYINFMNFKTTNFIAYCTLQAEVNTDILLLVFQGDIGVQETICNYC